MPHRTTASGALRTSERCTHTHTRNKQAREHTEVQTKKLALRTKRFDELNCKFVKQNISLNFYEG